MEEEIAETEYCSNCRRDIPAANYVMHVTHCQRNLTLCKECGDPVPTSQLEEHFEENHVKVKCECGEQVEKMNLEEHKEKDCPCRLVKCQFCDLEIAFSELLSHTEYCGSRTEKCEICDRYIQKKDLEVHMASDCQYPVKDEKKSVPSKRPADKVSPEMPIGMLDAMGLGGSSETSPHMEDYLGPFVAAGMREFGRIINTGFGTPPFNIPTGYLGDFEFEDTSVNGRDVIARGAARGMAKPSFDRPSTDDFEYVDVDYTEQIRDDDDEMLARAYQDDEFDYVNGTYGTKIVDEPFPNTQYSRPLADLTNDKTQLPCEFCGRLFPLDSLILHQSGCQLKSFASYPGSGSADIFFDGTPMYNVPRRINCTDVFHGDVANHRQPTGEDNEDDPDVTFLPCEFCQELFPYDNLVIHQAVCDAGPPSLAPTPVYNGSPQPAMNNARPESRRRTRSRPSRPVYERENIQTTAENFIPRELDDFGPDSLDVARNENGLYREKDSYGYDKMNSTPMNNEVPRKINRDRALDRDTPLIRNTDDAAVKQQLPKAISGDGAQAMIRNNERVHMQPRKEEFRAHSVAVDQPGKRPLELKNGFTSTFHQASAVKPLGRGMVERKVNTGASRKPVDEQGKHFREPRTHDSNNRVKASKSRVKESTERSKRDVGTKEHNKAHKSYTRSNQAQRTGVNEVSAAEVRFAVPRPNKAKSQDSYKTVDPSLSSVTHQVPSNPRRNPPTFKVDGIHMNGGREPAHRATSESQAIKVEGIQANSSDTQGSLPSKRTIKKKVV